ncbi:MAG: glycosyltransferase family 2 protein [Planctomycetota bacterium]
MEAEPRGRSSERAPRVCTVVVSYNTRELTLACAESFLAETRGIAAELVIVDNASSDGSPEALARRFPRDEYPNVTLHLLADNLGFGAACNLGARGTRAERLLMLNPDTVVLDRGVERLVEFADRRPEARMWGGRTVFPDGALNPASCWRQPTPWSSLVTALGFASALPSLGLMDPEGYGGWLRDSVREVDIVSGCFLLIDRPLWEALGGFHPDFFMYGEDADLSLRARRAGARPLIDPESVIVHLGGASERVRADQMVRLFTGKAQLYRKFAAPLAAWWMLRCLDLWALHRATALSAVALVSARRREAARTWREIFQRRAAWRDAFWRTQPYAKVGAARAAKLEAAP